MRRLSRASLFVSAFFAASTAHAQFSLGWFNAQTGGGTSSGGSYTLRGTIGQDGLGSSSAGSYRVMGGFWSIAAAAEITGGSELLIEQSGVQLQLSWPAALTGFVLQETTTLGTPWTDASGLPLAIGSRNVLSVTPSGTSRFFRLIRHASPIFFGPLPYLSSTDIPEGLYANGPTVLEDFEDGKLDTTIAASVGVTSPPAFPAFADSVDADDGKIDGLGSRGHSWFFSPGRTGIRFTFPADTTAAGLAWTDSRNAVTFSAFGPGGALLGSIGPFNLADDNFAGTTAEDRFFGIAHSGGIESIFIGTSGEGGIEVDHVQYGKAHPSVPRLREEP
ncbi:MAG: hypothetical protein L0Z50_15150 [Verrucomicrobiales bacterium]|nr:hypothetical protein [Verrucomicrobiales bacterium]